jgi:hypothetical protein
MPRTLAMHEVRVTDAERGDYLAGLPARTARAEAIRAHFWVFEHVSDRGRFIEFTEAASAQEIAAARGVDTATDCWREVQGG